VCLGRFRAADRLRSLGQGEVRRVERLRLPVKTGVAFSPAGRSAKQHRERGGGLRYGGCAHLPRMKSRLHVERPRDCESDGSCSLTWSSSAPMTIERGGGCAAGGCVCVGAPGADRLRAHPARMKSAGVWSGCAIASLTGAALCPGRVLGADDHRAWRWLRCGSRVCVRSSGS